MNAKMRLLALAAVVLLVGTAPGALGRKLLDEADLHPVEPGTLPTPASMASSEAAFEKDLSAAATTIAIEQGADATTTAASMGSSVAGADAGAEMEPGLGDDEYDFGWEDWDQPDADTWFYQPEMDDEDDLPDNGWTWDDPLDLEGDNSWDTEWAPNDEERDESFDFHVNATMNALNTHITPSVYESASVGKALVRAGVSEVLDIEDHPRNDLLLEVLTILPLLPPVLLVFFLMRAASQTLTMHHLVQFACFFCAGYSLLLIVAAYLTGDDPLAAFQFMAGHGAYIKYQFMVAIAYSLLLLLLYVNVCVQRCGTGAIVQQVTATCIGLHYYLGTFHPAMIGLPPETVFGLPTGIHTYMLYLCAFFVLGALPPREKTLGEDEEDDKTLGEGKGQD
jgi:hypothetical protein